MKTFTIKYNPITFILDSEALIDSQVTREVDIDSFTEANAMQKFHQLYNGIIISVSSEKAKASEDTYKFLASILVLALLVLTGCGTEQESSPASASVDQPEMSEVSFNVASREDLPKCTPAIRGALAYLRDSAIFMGCTEVDWEEIVIKGEKGEKGEQGIAGEKGEQGVAGVDGVNGLDGEDGEDLTEKGVSSVYVDPDSGVNWILLHDSQNYADASAACLAEGGSLPSSGFSYKLNYFFYVYFSTLADGSAYWTDATHAGGHVARTISSNGATTSNRADNETLLTFCLK